MSTEKLLGLTEQLVAFSRKNGASQVEVLVRQGTEFSVDIREGEIEKLTEAGSKGLSLRVFVDGKMARASSSDLSKETLNHLMTNAIERAKLSSADPLAGLPEKEAQSVDVASLKISDPALLEMSPEKKIAAARETEAICLGGQTRQEELRCRLPYQCGGPVPGQLERIFGVLQTYQLRLLRLSSVRRWIEPLRRGMGGCIAFPRRTGEPGGDRHGKRSTG